MINSSNKSYQWNFPEDPDPAKWQGQQQQWEWRKRGWSGGRFSEVHLGTFKINHSYHLIPLKIKLKENGGFPYMWLEGWREGGKKWEQKFYVIHDRKALCWIHILSVEIGYQHTKVERQDLKATQKKKYGLL